jgi:para-aminobenzoate synthetase component I
MTLDDFKIQMNKWGRDRVPFLFMVDFEMENPRILKLDSIDPAKLLYNFNGIGNGHQGHQSKPSSVELAIKPIPYSKFKKKFETVMHHIKRGDSFLANLTFKSSITNSIDLKELFYCAKAKYKLWARNQFVFYSPESFIKIKEGNIFTFPMKGTIDASIENASDKILADPKELAEHITIVDLLRNDLGKVATNVKVNRFRYVEEIKSSDKTILQVSTEIEGRLPLNYTNQLGEILVGMLPAGSISGAPKTKTVEIIRSAERIKRGYYTGVAGIFDGANLDSCVMIRFIEQKGDRFYYRSGGGITSQSDPQKEYKEMLDKIYVPTF